MRATRFQTIVSYILPIKIWHGSSTLNPVLELFLYRGNWQLTTERAIYSDGKKYRPLLLAFKKIKSLLPTIRSVLVLGSGLGSAVQILDHMKCNAVFDLVDNDEQILKLADDLLKRDDVHFILSDANEFVKNTNNTYDLIVVDVFSERTVPMFITTTEFIQQCRRALNPGGTFVVNFMLNNKQDEERLLQLKEALSPYVNEVELGINRVLIAKV